MSWTSNNAQPNKEVVRTHHPSPAEAIKANNPKLALSNFEHAGNFTEAILMGNIAMRVGEGFDWNAKKLQSSNKKATAFATKEYRAGWEV